MIGTINYKNHEKKKKKLHLNHKKHRLISILSGAFYKKIRGFLARIKP